MKNLGNIKKYVSNVMGLSLSEETQNPILASPLNRFFELCAVKIGNTNCCLLLPVETAIRPSMLIKRVRAVVQSTKQNGVLILDAMDKTLRRELIKAGIPFIVPDRQLFLPFIGAYLTDMRLNEISKRKKLTPAAQLLLLYHLQKGKVENMPLSEVANKIGYPLKTLSLVANELKDAQLCVIESSDGPSKHIKFQTNNRDLWNVALPMLSSPIAQKRFISKEKADEIKTGCISGDSALSNYTAMGITDKRALALDRRSDFAKLLIPELESTEGSDSVSIEFWKYAPDKLSKDNYIDPLSLYLCYMDNQDERIQGQIKRLIDRIL